MLFPCQVSAILLSIQLSKEKIVSVMDLKFLIIFVPDFYDAMDPSIH